MPCPLQRLMGAAADMHAGEEVVQGKKGMIDRRRLLLKNIAKYSSFHGDKVKWMEGSYLVEKGLVSAN